jgi:hypothetical protein
MNHAQTKLRYGVKSVNDGGKLRCELASGNAASRSAVLSDLFDMAQKKASHARVLA